MKLLKRKEIIEIWKSQSKEFLNSYCCPNCRDLLYNKPAQIDTEDLYYLYCHNLCCSNFDVPILNNRIKN